MRLFVDEVKAAGAGPLVIRFRTVVGEILEYNAVGTERVKRTTLLVCYAQTPFVKSTAAAICISWETSLQMLRILKSILLLFW